MKYLKLKNKIKKLEDEKNNLTWSKFKLGRENGRLKEKIERLEKLNKDLVQEKAFLNLELDKKLKEPPVINISMDKENVDDIVKKVTENILGKKEHKCDKACFMFHVIKPIQNDIIKKFGKDIEERSKHLDEIIIFVGEWEEKLKQEYDFVEELFTVNFGTLRVKFK